MAYLVPGCRLNPAMALDFTPNHLPAVTSANDDDSNNDQKHGFRNYMRQKITLMKRQMTLQMSQ